MNTTDNVLLIILTSLMGLLIVAAIAIAIVVLRLVIAVRRVVDKAEGVVDSVESAADILTDAKGRMALFKLIKNIVKASQRRNK